MLSVNREIKIYDISKFLLNSSHYTNRQNQLETWQNEYMKSSATFAEDQGVSFQISESVTLKSGL